MNYIKIEIYQNVLIIRVVQLAQRILIAFILNKLILKFVNAQYFWNVHLLGVTIIGPINSIPNCYITQHFLNLYLTHLTQ